MVRDSIQVYIERNRVAAATATSCGVLQVAYYIFGTHWDISIPNA